MLSKVGKDVLVVLYDFCLIAKSWSIVLLPGVNPVCSSPSALLFVLYQFGEDFPCNFL